MNENTTAQCGYYSLYVSGILLYNHLIYKSADEKETTILQEHLDFYWGKMSQTQRDDFNYNVKKENE